MRLVLPLSLVGLLLADAAFGQSHAPVERWDRVVALQTKTESSAKHATGFLIQKDDEVFLITAHHAALETSGDTRLVYLTAEGESRWILLRGLFAKGASPWTQHKNSDLAIAKLGPEQAEDEIMASFRRIALPFDTLLCELPQRATGLEFVGFPMALGATPPISAIVVPGFLASRELTAETKWGHEPIVYATPAAAAGTSGGPVFVSAAHAELPAIVGMYVGVTGDNTGGKLSKLVPARLIRDAIEIHSTPAGEPADSK